jgi:predicted esterase
MEITVIRSCLACAALLFLYAAPLVAAAFEEGDLKDASGKPVLSYAVSAPKDMAPAGTTDPAKQVGLILCYHEHDGKVSDEMPPVIESLERLKARDGFVVIGVHHVDHVYTKEDRANTVELIAWAKKTFPINPRRIYNFGKGEGSTMSIEFAFQHPDLIACAIGYSWGFRFMPDSKDPENELPGIYLAIGLKDTPTHPPMVRDTYAKAKPKGYHLIFREFDAVGPSRHAPTNDEAMAWLIATRNKVLPLSAEETALVKPLSTPTPGASAFNAAMLVGGPQVGALVARLFTAKSESVKMMAIASAEHAVYGEATMAALAKVLTDKSAAARKAAIAALGINAQWGSHVAQEALAECVTGGKRFELGDHILAIEAIAKATALQTIRQTDVILYSALVKALDDEQAGVRAAAFTVLQPYQTSDYKPEADKAARKTALAAWQTWLDGIIAKEPTAKPAGPAR